MDHETLLGAAGAALTTLQVSDGGLLHMAVPVKDRGAVKLATADVAEIRDEASDFRVLE